MKPPKNTNRKVVVIEPIGKELHVKRSDGRFIVWPRRITVSGSPDPIAAACASIGVDRALVKCTIEEADES